MQDDDDDDDAPPMAVSTRSSRANALADALVAPTDREVRENQLAAQKRQRSLITSDLRGADYLPPDVLAKLPEADSAPGKPDAPAHPKRTRPTASSTKQERPRVQAAPSGVPRVVRKGGNLEVAVLDDGSSTSRVRLHAPIQASVRDFMQQQLYGDRVRRAPAATLESLKPRGGKFGPASNFSSVHMSRTESNLQGRKGSSGQKRKRANAARDEGGSGGFSTLEKMAARIMRGKQS